MDKKNEILKAAHHLFSEKGYNLSMSEIAEAVNIKTPSLYSHFKSKDEIIELTINAEIENFFNTLCKETKKINDRTCEEQLKYLLFYSIGYYKKSSRLRFWKHISLVQNKKIRNMNISLIQENNKCLVEHIKSCFEQGINEKEIKDTVNDGSIYLYFSMLQGILNSMLFHQDSSITIEEFTAMTWDAYWDGIKV